MSRTPWISPRLGVFRKILHWKPNQSHADSWSRVQVLSQKDYYLLYFNQMSRTAFHSFGTRPGFFQESSYSGLVFSVCDSPINSFWCQPDMLIWDKWHFSRHNSGRSIRSTLISFANPFETVVLDFIQMLQICHFPQNINSFSYFAHSPDSTVIST